MCESTGFRPFGGAAQILSCGHVTLRSFIHPSVGISVGPSICTSRKVGEMLLVYVSVGGHGVGCPCPLVYNDIVTPRHLLLIVLQDTSTCWPAEKTGESSNRGSCGYSFVCCNRSRGCSSLTEIKF